MATDNYNLSQYSHGVKGWDFGMNQNFRTINDQANAAGVTQVAGAILIALNSTSFASSSNTAYTPLGYNMGFDIWQRGTSFTGTSAAMTADMWWKNADAEVTQQSGSSFNNTYVAQLKKHTASTSAAIMRNGIPFPSKYHNLMRFFRNRVVTFSADVQCSTASEARIAILDGTGTTFSSYHAGDGNVHRLTVTRTLSVMSSELSISCRVDGSGTAISAKFGNCAVAVGSFTSLAYVPRMPQEDELACRSMYQNLVFDLGWGGKPANHIEKLSLTHPVPMRSTPDIVSIQKGSLSTSGDFTLTATGSSTMDSVVEADGFSRPAAPYNVGASGNTLTLELSYINVPSANIPAQYSVS